MATPKVIPNRTKTSGAGAITSGSSIPWWRCQERAPPQPNTTVDQMPMMPAPNA